MENSSVYLVSLGCAKNLVDSEVMLGTLLKHNYPIARSPSKAAVIIVNTCAFIQPAKEEALETILALAHHKKAGACRLLIVAGCLPQRYRQSLAALLPEVDVFVGTGEFHRIVEIIHEQRQSLESSRFHLRNTGYLYNHTSPRVNTTLPGSAFVKIAEGCSHRCSFCIIPKLRGPFRSRHPDSVIQEVVNLSRLGIKEINLIAQDTTMYGRDLSPPTDISSLLRRLAKISGIAWIRLLYGNPQHITDDLLEVLGEEKAICRYLDLPLQHVNPEILRSMNRDYHPQGVEKIIEKIRGAVPGITIRTALMVGFPGETDDQFLQLLDFVRCTEFDRLGVFTHSCEEGTRAAQLPHQISEDIKRMRRDAIMKAQATISRKKHKALVGTVQEVLVQKEGRTRTLGRNASQAPDVDGVTWVTNNGNVRLGEIYPTLITRAGTYDLYGSIITSQ